MFIREIVKKNKGYKQTFIYHALMESFRTERGPRQRMLLQLGHLGLGREKWKHLANRIEEIVNGEVSLFPCDSEIEPLAQHYSRLLTGKRVKESPVEVVERAEADYEEVDVNSLRNEDSRSIGGEHVCLSMLRFLGFDTVLRDVGFSEVEIKLAEVLIIGRLLCPGSELHTYIWAKELSALGELLGLDISRLSHNRLYKCSDALVRSKREIEDRLSGNERRLFELEEKIILYDLTNTYFESGIGKSKKKRYGNSKEKRKDCPLVTLALVLDECGFPKRSDVFEGNVSEGKTLLRMVRSLDSADHDVKRTVIIDAGIATEDNIGALRAEGYDYICVARNKPLKEFPQEGFITIRHSGKDKIELRFVHTDNENILCCRSLRRQRKEEAMRTRFQERFESALNRAAQSLHKKGGTKRYSKVLERIGRLRERHRRVSYFYDITVEQKDGFAVNITWGLKDESVIDERFSGTYFLRTSRTDFTEEGLWSLYLLLTDVEDSFRSMKSELGLRPNYHQKDQRIDGHLFITVLAYHVVNSIQWYLHQKDIYMRWNTIRMFLSKQVRVTTQMATRDGKTVTIRNTSEPEPFHIMIADALGINPKPLKKKKWKNKNP